MKLDGLTDEEFERRHEEAVRLRGIGGNSLSQVDMMGLILDLVSRPRSDLQNETYTPVMKVEAARDWWDLADWMKFLHEFQYKPEWVINLTTPVNHPSGQTINLDLETIVPMPVTFRLGDANTNGKLGLRRSVVAMQVRDDRHAVHILEQMINEAERVVSTAWLHRDPK